MIRLFNTLSKKKEVLRARQREKIRLFVCGPTVYDYSHLGHARTYIAFDMIVKYLRWKGFWVFYLQNITDMDDKIIRRAAKERQSPLAIARKFTKAYRADMKAFGVDAVDKYVRATSHIGQIIKQVGRLFKKGYAYEIERDGVYFDVSKFQRYGRLSGRTTLQAQDATSRIDESVAKRNKGDFALWKLSKAGEPKWKSPWGYGRPGWHIEDTAITEMYFGPQYDIHGGAQDLIFPHHEAEIAQMEAISGKRPFVKYWLHTGFLTVKGEKMSKSLGNFTTLRDFLKKHLARLLRFFILKSHYRSPIDYSEELVKQAENELRRLDEFVDRLKLEIRNPKSETNSKSTLRGVGLGSKIQNSQLTLERAMDDDFNTPLAMAILFDLVRDANIAMHAGRFSKKDAKAMLDFLKRIDKFFGFIFWGSEKQSVPKEIKKLVEQREAHRTKGNFQEADALRLAIYQKGWLIQDTPSGPQLKKVS